MPSNVEVVVRSIEALSTRDLETLRRLSTEDVEVIPLRAMVEDTIYRGQDGLATWMRDIEDTWQELTIDIEQIEETRPGYVEGLAIVHGRGKGSAAPTQMRITITAELRDGLIAKAATQLATR